MFARRVEFGATRLVPEPWPGSCPAALHEVDKPREPIMRDLIEGAERGDPVMTKLLEGMMGRITADKKPVGRGDGRLAQALDLRLVGEP